MGRAVARKVFRQLMSKWFKSPCVSRLSDSDSSIVYISYSAFRTFIFLLPTILSPSPHFKETVWLWYHRTVNDRTAFVCHMTPFFLAQGAFPRSPPVSPPWSQQHCVHLELVEDTCHV